MAKGAKKTGSKPVKGNPKNIITDGAAKRRHAIAAAQSKKVESISMGFHARGFAPTGPSSPPKGGNYGRRYHRTTRATRTTAERMLDQVRRNPPLHFTMEGGK